MSDPLARDLDEILELARDDLRALSGARLYVTGGTGFVGTWILRAIAHANRRIDAGIRVDVLTRDAAAFAAREPVLAAERAFMMREGTVTAPVTEGRYDGVIHGATPTAREVRRLSHDQLFDAIVDGTETLIERVVAPSGPVPVLFLSSGAVYGEQPAQCETIPETYERAPGRPELPNGYRDGKRAAESRLTQAQHRGQGRLRLARLFAFLGPGLPLDAHFAAGNFIRDALAGGPIRIAGDGTPYRSYLYPTDMVAWSLAVFVRGMDARAYNVGSSDGVTIRDLAQRIAAAASGSVAVEIARSPTPGVLPARYVPDTSRIETELSVRSTIQRDEAISRTLAYYRDAAV